MGRVKVGGCSCVGKGNHGGKVGAAMEREESDNGGSYVNSFHLFVEPPYVSGTVLGAKRQCSEQNRQSPFLYGRHCCRPDKTRGPDPNWWRLRGSGSDRTG